LRRPRACPRHVVRRKEHHHATQHRSRRDRSRDGTRGRGDRGVRSGADARVDLDRRNVRLGRLRIRARGARRRLTFISWFDASGARTRQLVTGPAFKITWTNPATGASVTTANPFAVHKYDNPDGSMTVAFTGLFFAIPGGGRAYVDSGRAVLVFSDGSVELLSTAGPSDDLCEALTAAIG
jgi:hypothetical protein